MMRTVNSYRFALTLAVCLLLACPAQALEKTSVVLQWLPQAQFAGFYMAQEKGFYQEAGLDVTLISGGPDVLASEYLELGKAEFATLFLSTGLHKRSSLSIVNVGQFVQHSALMLIAMKGRGIEKIEDLGWKKVGLWANEFQMQARSLFRQKGLKVTVVPQSDSLDLFMRGGVAAASGMWYNEYHTLLNYGLDPDDLQPFFFRDYDLDFPEDGLYCLESTANAKPEVAEALTKATARGWMYAFNHTDETLEVILKRMHDAHVPANRPHQLWMLKRMENIILDDETPTLGTLHKEDYERVKQTLIESGFIKKAPPYEEFYRGPK